MLDVYVGNRKVAKLENTKGDQHSLTYLPDTPKENFVSLVMPAQSTSWIWERGLHPYFQMNLPEGFLLSVLREIVGPVLDGRDITLLGVVGRNAIGRTRTVPAGEPPEERPDDFNIDDVMKARNTEENFKALVRRYARSGISGVIPKFLDPELVGTKASFLKATVNTRRHIVKGFATQLPGVAINEWICLEAARKAGLDVATARISEDGQVLVVDRFDLAEDGHRYGMEDACSLLGMRPQNKYDTTWERLTSRISQIVASATRRQELEKLGRLIVFCLMTRNADCHAKNVAVMYDTAEDVRLTPAYDLFTTSVYEDARFNNFSLSMGGTKSWTPGKRLESFASTSLQLEPRELRAIMGRTAQALIDTTPKLLELAKEYPHFRNIGKLMAGAWKEGMDGLMLENSPGSKIARALKDKNLSPAAVPRKKRGIGGSTMLSPKQR